MTGRKGNQEEEDDDGFFNLQLRKLVFVLFLCATMLPYYFIQRVFSFPSKNK
jgi:hypothetical protein